MFSRTRYYGGLASLIVFVTYFVISVVSNFAATPAQEVKDTVQFYEEAATSWSQILTLMGAVVWVVAMPLHAMLLMSKRNPQRVTGVVAITGLVSLFVFVLFSRLESSGYSPPASQTPDWAFWLVMLLPLMVQILDLVLPPWPWGSQKAPIAVG